MWCREFVAQITELARRAAIDTLEAALGRPRGSPRRRRCRDGRSRRGARPGREAHRRTSSRSCRSGSSTFVKKNPGLRIEQINKQLGTTTKDLALPIRKLIAEGAIKAKGQKRSTTYFAGREARPQELTGKGSELDDRHARASTTRSRTALLRQAAEQPVDDRLSGEGRRSLAADHLAHVRRPGPHRGARADRARASRAAARSRSSGFNRPEWVIFDHAAMMAGGAPAGIYTTCSPEEVQYIVHHSEAHVVLVENAAQLAKVEAKRAELPLLQVRS